MLILASSSPRRRELLTEAGIAFTVESIPIDESHRPVESPTAFTQRLAREKAEAVFAALTQNPVESIESPALYQGMTSVVPQQLYKKNGASSPCYGHSVAQIRKLGDTALPADILRYIENQHGKAAVAIRSGRCAARRCSAVAHGCGALCGP